MVSKKTAGLVKVSLTFTRQPRIPIRATTPDDMLYSKFGRRIGKRKRLSASSPSLESLDYRRFLATNLQQKVLYLVLYFP
jgi:hypothetical protein